MTQHKVISEDSLSAMDEISKVLGKDAVILKTTKVNGKIEILGSNNIEDIASSNAKKIIKQKSNFGHLFSNHNLEQKIQNRKVNNILDEKKLNQNEHLENVVQTAVAKMYQQTMQDENAQPTAGEENINDPDIVEAEFKDVE